MKETGNDLVFSELVLLLLAGAAAWCLIFVSGIF